MLNLSNLFQTRRPSAVRRAQIKYAHREDDVEAINTAIGNVSLPMYPSMQTRMKNLDADDSPFKDGVLRYTSTVGQEESRKAFLNIIAASGFETTDLQVLITSGGSQAMELVILGSCGRVGSENKPFMVLDPAYTNYESMAKRVQIKTISAQRTLEENGRFTLPDLKEIEKMLVKENPGAMLIIPYDNPSGKMMSQQEINDLAKLCVKHDIWLISDEAYRELYYTGGEVSSVWGVTEKDVPGITGHRISIDSTSKVWNACGLRIGALITDSDKFHQKALAEATPNLCANAIGQYIVGALAEESYKNLQNWFQKQRDYYHSMFSKLVSGFQKELPEAIVSKPEASIYSVVDVRKIVDEDFKADEFVEYCAVKGSVDYQGQELTLLVSPMSGFYSVSEGEANPGRTQMRIAYVESPENMEKVPTLFAKLLKQYLSL